MGKYAIFIVSALIFSMLTYSSALRNAVFMSNTRTVQTHSENQAYNIAQSAAMVAINDIRSDPGGSPFNPDPDSTYSYPSSNSFEDWVEMHGEYNVTTTNQGDTLLTIRSTGRFEESTYQVRIGLVKSTGGGFAWPPFNTAIHAENSISVVSGSQVRGSVSVNSTNNGAVVTAWQNPAITGNVLIGPGGVPEDVAPSVSQWHSNYVGGEIVPMTEEKSFPLPDYPEVPILPTGTSLKTEQWNDPTNFNASQFNGFYIPELKINQNRSMYLNIGSNDVKLYVGHLNIPTGHLNIVGNGTLEIHVVNNITLGSGSSINCNAQYWTNADNCSGTTEQVTTFYGGSSTLNLANGTFFNGNMYVKNADLNLSGGNGFLGNIISGGDDISITGGADAVSRVIYAPNAHVELRNGGTLTGSIIADTYYSDGGTWVEYDSELDTDLPDLNGNGGGAPTFSVTYWN